MKLKRPLLLAALTLAGLGGVYFGLFSCGGYVWHRQLFFGSLGALTLVSLIFERRRTSPIWGRIGVVAAVGLAFFFTQALAAPFYPAPPESWQEFVRLFLFTLERGPC